MIEKIKEEIPQDDSTSEEEKQILAQSILDEKPKVIVEIGTHRGLTTCYLALSAKEVGGHVHTYDPIRDWGAEGNFRKFPELPITYHEAKGKDCDLETIDWLFIDGYHEKHFVIEEIDALFPKLSDGAVVWFHDTNGSNPSCDVPGAVDEKGLKVEYIKTQNGLAKYVHNPNAKHKTSVPRRNTKSARKSDEPKVRVARGSRAKK